MECKIILTVGGGAVFTVGLIIGQIIFLERSHGPHSESAQILAVDNLPFEDRFFICWRGNTASISLERQPSYKSRAFFYIYAPMPILTVLSRGKVWKFWKFRLCKKLSRS